MIISPGGPASREQQRTRVPDFRLPEAFCGASDARRLNVFAPTIYFSSRGYTAITGDDELELLNPWIWIEIGVT